MYSIRLSTVIRTVLVYRSLCLFRFSFSSDSESDIQSALYRCELNHYKFMRHEVRSLRICTSARHWQPHSIVLRLSSSALDQGIGEARKRPLAAVL